MPEPRTEWGRCLTPSLSNACWAVLGLSWLPFWVGTYQINPLAMGLAYLLYLWLPVIGTGILHFRVVPMRAGDRSNLARGATRLLVFSIFALLWLDAGPVILALGLEDATWWTGYVLFSGLVTGILLVHRQAIGPGPTRRVLAALWVWTAVLPWIPWNEAKTDAHRFLSVAHGSVGDVREAFAYQESCHLSRQDGSQSATCFRDFPDQKWSDVTSIELSGFGGASIYLREGRVSGFWFHYD